MNKIILGCVGLLLIFAVPALAGVTITATRVSSTEVTVSFTNTDQMIGNPVRSVALDITVGAADVNHPAIITSVIPAKRGPSSSANPGYGIFPASFARVINPADPNWNDAEYTPVALLEDLPADTQPGIGTNAVTVELGSLYVGGPNKPVEGDLLTLVIALPGGGNVGLALNASRVGVVMEDNTTPTPALVGCTLLAGTCWDAVNECAGQLYGDATCDGTVNIDDLRELKDAWGDTPYNCTTDFNRDETVNIDDLRVLKDGWGLSGFDPNSLNQTCP